MSLPIRWLNCLWLIVPLLVWNLIFVSGLSQEIFQSDLVVPQVVLVAETVLRMLVFTLPLFIPLVWDTRLSRIGLVLYIVGSLIYFASWLPLLYAPEAAWSTSAPGLLAPYVTPLLYFSGIALIGGSWSYGLVGVLFVVVHLLHGLFALNVL